MAKIDRLIRELSGYIAGAELVMTEEVFEAVVAPYRSKPAKRPPAKRVKPRVEQDRAPRPKSDPVIVFPDGREVCRNFPLKGSCPAGTREYKRRLKVMEDRQDHICALHGHPLIRTTFDHENGRGGGKRDDHIWTPEGLPMNAAVCEVCNMEKGSKRIPYEFQYQGTREEYEAKKKAREI